MGLFDNFRKQKEVWRDSNGNIRCPGDSCPQECDDRCPIWCQTMAISLMNMGHGDKAADSFKRALSIAPDFKEAWVNLAATYGGMNDHMEANKAYKTAYAIDKNYRNAIFGIIISCKNLGQFEEALAYCEEYSRFDKTEAEKLKAQVIEVRDSGKIGRQESAFDMFMKILQQAREMELLPTRDHFQQIPEIISQAKPVCQAIFKEMIKLENGRNPSLWLAWGAYAGMGAVYHWHINWNGLKEKGIAETLLEPRGAFAMDEYVIDSIGIGFETEEGKKLAQEVFNLSMWTLVEFFGGCSAEILMRIALEAMQSMYMFGMVYEMERLRMR